MQGCQEQLLMLGTASLQVLGQGCGSGPGKGLSQARTFCTSVPGGSLSKFPSDLCVYSVPEAEQIFRLFSKERC